MEHTTIHKAGWTKIRADNWAAKLTLDQQWKLYGMVIDAAIKYIGFKRVGRSYPPSEYPLAEGRSGGAATGVRAPKEVAMRGVP